MTVKYKYGNKKGGWKGINRRSAHNYKINKKKNRKKR